VIGLSKQIFVVQRIKKYNIWLLIKYLWIRYKVFVGEYKRPIIKEFDMLDIIAEHYLLLVNKRKVGTVRVVYRNYMAIIGRVSVLAQYRNKGYATQLINQIITHIKNSNKANLISLFTIDHNSINFYKRFGFVENGEVFFDNVPYINMILLV